MQINSTGGALALPVASGIDWREKRGDFAQAFLGSVALDLIFACAMAVFKPKPRVFVLIAAGTLGAVTLTCLTLFFIAALKLQWDERQKRLREAGGYISV